MYIAQEIREKIKGCSGFDLLKGYGVKDKSMIRFTRPSMTVHSPETAVVRYVMHHYPDGSSLKHILYAPDKQEIGQVRTNLPELLTREKLRQKAANGRRNFKATRF